MDNLYIIESPLQAFCALEISLSKPKETHGIIVKISNGNRIRNDKQILSIADKRKWDFFYTIKNQEPKNIFLRYLSVRKQFFYIKKQFPYGVSNLYLGEFRSVFMHRVRCAFKVNKVFLLDDGTATIKIVHQYLSKNCFYPQDMLFPKSKYRAFMHKFFYYGVLDFRELEKKIDVLTAYDKLNYKRIEQLSFSSIKRAFKKEYYIDNALVYYYGSRYSESGIISLEYELHFLTEIAKFYKLKNKRVIYFAHRDESLDKLNTIKNKLNFDISIPDKTAEVYLLESSILPAEIASAFSSVLVNVALLFPEVKLQSFRIFSPEIAKHLRLDIEMIYDYFAKSGIQIQDLNLDS